MTHLIFIANADDAACYNIKRLISITCKSDGVLLLHFESSVGKSDGADTVQINIVADSEKEVLIRFFKEIRNKNYIVICDDVTKEYIDSRMTGCVITLDT
jgi:hypothetical protein